MNPHEVVSRQHADCLAVLTRYAQHTDDDRQRELALDIRSYVERTSDATTRACRPDHVTASAVVISPDASAVMLDLHRKANRWLQFGGHLEDTDATLAEAALREAHEESGCADLRLLVADPVMIDVHPAPCGAQRHLDVQFVAVAPRGARPVASAESHDVRWFAVDDLPPDADPSVRRLVAQAVVRVSAGSASGAPTPSS